MFNRLYLRIWLAVVAAVAVLTLLVGWVWRMAAEPTPREVVVRNPAGDVIGRGHLHPGRPPGLRMRREHPPGMGQGMGPGMGQGMGGGAMVESDAGAELPAGERAERGPWRARPAGEGPEFEVRMHQGQTLYMHLPRPSPSNWRTPFGFFWTLVLVAVAVALGTYPIVRRLTRRLEALQHGVQQWGEGKLEVRVPESGTDEVGYLARRFNHAAEQVQALVGSRDALLASQKSLLANASHELRSPLARIRMGLELLGDAPAAAVRDELKRNIAELDQLIEEILLASRLDAQQADLGTVEPVDLVGLVAEECARVQASLDVPGAQTEVLVPGVAKLLRRVVRNLLENAQRHAGSGAEVELKTDGAQAVLRVCDSGPGVPEAYQGRIFEPFFRLPGASERDGGVGLGLALVKSIVERHGGTARCSNRAQRGACFEIRLPLAPGP